MLFNPRTLFVGATALLLSGLASAQDAPAGGCTGGPWKDPQYVGGEVGTEFCHSKYQDGIVMNGIEIWSAKKNIQAIQFYYSDGSNSGTIGKTEKNKDRKRLDWDSAADGISQVRVWADKKGESVGRIYIRTKNGAEIDLGKEGESGPVETQVNSGLLLGVSGRADETINGLSFLFLGSKIDKITLTDLKFDDSPEDLNKRMQGLQTMVLDYADHTNSMSDSNETFTFGKTETRTESKEFSTSSQHSFGAKYTMGISGEILGLGVSSSYELSYSYTTTKTETKKTEKSIALNYVVATMLKPNQRVYCRATAMMGEYEGGYTSTMNVKLEDNSVWKFRSDGTMKQVAWSQASSKCQSDPFPNDASMPAPGGSSPSNSTVPAMFRRHPRSFVL